MDRGHIWNRQDTGSWGMELATPGLWAVNDCIRFYSHCIFSRSTVGRFYLLSSIVHGISIKNKKIRRFKVTLFIHLLCSIHSQKFNIIYSKQCTDPPTDRHCQRYIHTCLSKRKRKSWALILYDNSGSTYCQCLCTKEMSGRGLTTALNSGILYSKLFSLHPAEGSVLWEKSWHRMAALFSARHDKSKGAAAAVC